MSHEDFIAAAVASAVNRGEPFVIEAASREGRYVQGGLTDDRMLYLEAADLDLQGTGTLDEEQIAALRDLGFERGELNFSRRVEVPPGHEPGPVAAPLLARVFGVYGVDERAPLRAGGVLSSDWLDIRDVRGTPYPPYVETQEQRRRWNWATLVAAATSRQEGGAADDAFAWQITRTIYADESFVADGSEQDFRSALEEARSLGLVPDESELW